MKITTVSASMSRRIVKSYQSFENSVGLSADLESGDDPHRAVCELQKQCFAELVKQYPYDRPRKKTPAQTAPVTDRQLMFPFMETKEGGEPKGC